MGYDMYWRRVDDAEKEAVTKARALFMAAVEARDALPGEEAGVLNAERAKAHPAGYTADENYDGRSERYRQAQAAVVAASDTVDQVRKSYFRLNIFSMGRYRDAMYRLGMAFDDDPRPDWPRANNYGITDEQVWAVESPEDYPEVYAAITSDMMSQILAYQQEHERVLSWHGKTDMPGIPLHKFGSNDGWVVLPAECEAAVRIWRKHHDEHGDVQIQAVLGEDLSYWLKWIDFLQGAITHDGFEVL
ncbi:hypothetical protein Ppa06_69870 [Planomonospora parontospora subsp. parontospora]|uniref:Uncharacterized protein n=2 Tax=Planomonospora parontospora TaxID=58119 RepID=A0AA37F926_9ACTN|nr:hypothetical protein [Planomonospora parontospora]GGL01306.1 hypothetical protein GCM10010126_70700 [Planomonospora parontospora]GII13189.1 hypothetical protein Ppa06_69870 [Planomonospora parontospora subsp. parontospora]